MSSLLAFHAHPDDESVSTGVTLAKYADEGHRVVVATATDGSAGGSHKGQALAKTRANETIKGLSKLTKPIFLNHPDGRLFDNAKYITIQK